MIQSKRFISRITYKVLNQVKQNVEVTTANDRSTAKRIVEEKYNSNGKQLIQIKSLREMK